MFEHDAGWALPSGEDVKGALLESGERDTVGMKGAITGAALDLGFLRDFLTAYTTWLRRFGSRRVGWLRTGAKSLSLTTLLFCYHYRGRHILLSAFSRPPIINFVPLPYLNK